MCLYLLLIKMIKELIINYKDLMNNDSFTFKKIFNNFMKKF